MKTILAVILGCLFLSFAVVAPCAPFLVCDPQAGVTSYKLTGPAWVLIMVTAQPDGSIKMDVSTAIIGNNSLTVAACFDDPIWGELCSTPPTPFTFTRPAPAGVPVNTKLIK